MTVPPLGRMGLGTGAFHHMPPDARSAAESTVDAAYEAGIRYFDTAPFYGRGRAERWLGNALAGRPRDSYVLSTKVGRSPVDPAGRIRAEFDFSRDSVLRSIDESLIRLGLDAVDIVLIHDPDDHWAEAVGAAYPTLAELRDQGVVRAIGAGMNQWQMLARFVDETDVDVVLVAGRYTIIDTTAADILLPRCRERGVAVVAGGVFNSGVLATRELSGTYDYAPPPPSVVEGARAVEAVCERHGVSLPHAALAFAARHPAVTALLVGARHPDEVRRNVALLDTPVPEALWDELRREDPA